ncbi:MAG TPA: ATP-binding cassette domain-containing protein [Anaerolinea sp.]|nr:ATP-binding cassette domain-containing protein [Anaerolinea sp.]
MPIIQVDQLTKQFTRRKKRPGFWGGLTQLVSPDHEVITAVDQVSFNVEQGEIIGYIGPNGAGKSTTIKMLSGILVPTAGTIQVAGCVPHQQRTEHARHIGVVFGQRTHLWWDVPVIDSLHLLRDIYKVSEAQFRAYLEIFNDLLELNEFQNVPVRQLSLGQRVRADIAAALLHNPTILFLDEPTIGVDAISKDRLRTFIKEINHDRQVTILLTTHDMGEIEKLSSRVIIIDHGRLIYDGSITKIRAQYGSERLLSVEFDDEVPDFVLSNATHRRSEGRKKWYSFNHVETPVSELITGIIARYPVVDLTVEEPEIEEVIRAIYTDKAVQRKR